MDNIEIKHKITTSNDVIKIAEFIKNEKVILLPAKTIYGLSCRYDSKSALNKIYYIKGRDKLVPFIILISKIQDLFNFTNEISDNCKKLINYYWDKKEPDSLTIIFKKNPKISDYITSGKDTIAIRRAELEFVRNVIDISYPIVSTSATISGINNNPVELQDIDFKILQKVDLIVEFKEKLKGIQSTIIDATENEIKLVREGAISFNDILQKLQIKI